MLNFKQKPTTSNRARACLAHVPCRPPLGAGAAALGAVGGASRGGGRGACRRGVPAPAPPAAASGDMTTNVSPGAARLLAVAAAAAAATLRRGDTEGSRHAARERRLLPRLAALALPKL